MKSLDDIFPDDDPELGDAYLRGPEASYALLLQRNRTARLQRPPTAQEEEQRHYRMLTTLYMGQDA